MTNNNDMIGHKSQKQAICYCGKQATIQYGLKSLPFLQLVFYPPLLVLFFYVAFFGNGEFWARIGLLLLLGVFLFVVPIEAFVSTRRKMLKAGHSQNCSQRVALRETLYIGRFSRFAIIEKDNNTQGNK